MVNKIWTIMERYSAFERKGMLVHAAVWTSLEYIMLNETTHPKRTNGAQFHFYELFREVNCVVPKSMLTAGGRGGAAGQWVWDFLWRGWKVEMDSGDHCTLYHASKVINLVFSPKKN